MKQLVYIITKDVFNTTNMIGTSIFIQDDAPSQSENQTLTQKISKTDGIYINDMSIH